MLNCEQQRTLIQMVTMEEITKAVKDMPKDKAPEVDGFLVEFFTRNWEIVKEDIVKAVKDFFSANRLPSMINITAITLVPKVKEPATVKDCRPIACCTTLYKIISKVITRRIKGVLDGLIDRS